MIASQSIDRSMKLRKLITSSLALINRRNKGIMASAESFKDDQKTASESIDQMMSHLGLDGRYFLIDIGANLTNWKVCHRFNSLKDWLFAFWTVRERFGWRFKAGQGFRSPKNNGHWFVHQMFQGCPSIVPIVSGHSLLYCRWAAFDFASHQPTLCQASTHTKLNHGMKNPINCWRKWQNIRLVLPSESVDWIIIATFRLPMSKGKSLKNKSN